MDGQFYWIDCLYGCQGHLQGWPCLFFSVEMKYPLISASISELNTPSEGNQYTYIQKYTGRTSWDMAGRNWAIVSLCPSIQIFFPILYSYSTYLIKKCFISFTVLYRGMYILLGIYGNHRRKYYLNTIEYMCIGPEYRCIKIKIAV